MTRDKISQAVSEAMIPADTALVLFGSLARDEYTQGSDCDWSLLVDGLANSDHHTASFNVEAEIRRAEIPEPGPTDLFGSLAFSHELVHQIGGDEDINRNTTRRILMLLESTSISTSGRLVRDRVVRQLIKRYLEQEFDVQSPEGKRRYPRFLLNDIVRYWRTVAVDYARKVRDRQSEGWAIRNIKLRMSRKLTFVSGMLACFDCVLHPRDIDAASPSPDEAQMGWLSVQEQLLENIEYTPLEMLAAAVDRYSATDETKRNLACKLLDPYDKFIGLMNDKSARDELKNLDRDGDSNDIFQQGRQLGHDFQQGLLELFFETDSALTKATQEYGVF